MGGGGPEAHGSRRGREASGVLERLIISGKLPRVLALVVDDVPDLFAHRRGSIQFR
jgi:hypothetical protein